MKKFLLIATTAILTLFILFGLHPKDTTKPYVKKPIKKRHYITIK